MRQSIVLLVNCKTTELSKGLGAIAHPVRMLKGPCDVKKLEAEISFSNVEKQDDTFFVFQAAVLSTSPFKGKCF